MSERVVVGTRGSKLALAQTSKVVERLKEEGYSVEIRIIKSTGDIMKDKPLYEFKGSGAFVRALEHALVRGEIDVAVHSYKDIPSNMLEGVTVSAVLERDSPYDAFIARNGESLEEIKPNAVIGTSSLRRRAQLKLYRSDLRFENLRGNVDTRLRKLREGLYDAIVLAEAGIQRLGLNVKYQRLPIERFVPPANQGIIAVQTRVGEEDLVKFMNHEETWIEAEVERIVMKTLGVGCAIPAGIYAECRGKVRLIVQVIRDGREFKVIEELSRESAIEEAREIAENFREEVGLRA
ncbi:hydroxymethylbilane synthase [Archaeoglobus profundus]|uniref:Probable porphobilinogen deaminase n=1 Tax=Archaeoglobus profundus (strain DSM 5631 / JCM 9629 / NBRC 100127 / Av18) TaxID=572546 RepID=D2RH82_ARCPA|nr:hydroxymethylbilane synthase [Archaeoglobus profundus]ADB57657.1 porphobilinogen deaminase [Archaeoglobus profundus DSM 5631]